MRVWPTAAPSRTRRSAERRGVQACPQPAGTAARGARPGVRGMRSGGASRPGFVATGLGDPLAALARPAPLGLPHGPSPADWAPSASPGGRFGRLCRSAFRPFNCAGSLRDDGSPPTLPPQGDAGGLGREQRQHDHGRHHRQSGGDHVDDQGRPAEAQLLGIHHAGVDGPPGQLQRGGGVGAAQGAEGFVGRRVRVRAPRGPAAALRSSRATSVARRRSCRW